MLTQTMPALVKALEGVLPPGALKQLTQALGNCNQPLTHRGALNVQPAEYSYNRGLAQGGKWDPSKYSDLLPYAGQITNNFDVPGFPRGTTWNSYNYDGDNFTFPLNQDFTSNSYFGGPTVNIGGNVFFDNTNTNTLTTQNINTSYINNQTVNNFGNADLGELQQWVQDYIDSMFGTWWWQYWRRSQDTLRGEVRVPQHTHESKQITYAKEGIKSVDGYVKVDVVSGIDAQVEIPVDSIRAGTVAIQDYPGAISGGYVTVDIPQSTIRGCAVTASIPQSAISGVAATLSGVTVSTGGGYVVVHSPTASISGGTVSVGSIPTNAISGGTVSITGVPTNAISGGTVSVALSTTPVSFLSVTGVTLDPTTCVISLMGITVTVPGAVSVQSATFYGTAAATATRTASISGTAAATGSVTAAISGTVASTASSTYSLSGLTAAANGGLVSLTTTPCTYSAVACTVSASTASVSATNATLLATVIGATTRAYTLNGVTSNFDWVPVTVTSATTGKTFALTLQTTAASTASTTLAGVSKVLPPYVKTVVVPGGQ